LTVRKRKELGEPLGACDARGESFAWKTLHSGSEQHVYVTCFSRSCAPPTRPENNDYKNPFGSEIALFRTNDGGMSRMAVCWDIRQNGGERGRIYGQKVDKVAVNTNRPPLPPGVGGGGHGGSHGHLMSEFVDAILRDRKPWVDVAQALNMSVAGIVAHQSALKDGELLRIQQYKL